MNSDPYDHVREAFHTVADGLMGWEDPPERFNLDERLREAWSESSEHANNGPRMYEERAVSDSQPLRAYYCSEDVDTLERAGESLMRLRDESNAIRLFALALRIRQAL